MARRKRGNRSATVLGQDGDGGGTTGLRQKRPRLESRTSVGISLQLSEDQEDRLGRWSSSVQWIIKIAQNRGSNACLAMVSAKAPDQVEDACKLVMQSFDGQQMHVTIRSSWADKAASFLARAGDKELVLLSGIGAKIPPSGSEVVFQADNMIAEVVSVEDHRSRGCFEVADDQIVSMPAPNQDRVIESAAVHNNDHIEDERVERIAEESHLSPSSSTVRQPSHAPCETPVRNTHATRQATSVTPGWLNTPASDMVTEASAARPINSSTESAVKSSTHARRKGSIAKVKMLSTRAYTPVSMLQCNEKAAYNVIGLVTSDHTARRALSGTRDWKITINLVDVEESNKAVTAPLVPFNLFSREEGWLPRAKPGCILLLRGIKVRPFNNLPQGSGYPGQYDWAMMDTTEANIGEALFTSQSSNVWASEKEELIRLYDWYRSHHDARTHTVVRARNQRPLIKLQDVETEVFFDTTVEILKLWMGSPPEIYVTDYTTHPQVYAANDVHLDGYSREELYEQQQECNDAGNGRVLAISLWDDQQRVIESVQIGMVVRLENVRPKMQPNGFLCGTMGGSNWTNESKLKVILVKDQRILEDFQQRKENYLQEVALRRAERLAVVEAGNAEHETGRDEQDSASEQPVSSNAASECRIPSLMPPPGQKPLSVIENRSYELSETSASAKTIESQYNEQQEVPTLIDDKLSALPLNSLDQVWNLPYDQFKAEQSFLCLARVHDMKPSNLDDIVEVMCGLCKEILTPEFAFCAKCADEEGKDLRFRYNFALLIEPARRSHRDEEITRIPLLVRNEGAKHFLHGFHPKDIRNRDSTLERLKKRLLPLLGSRLVYGAEQSASQQQKAQPFRLAIRVSSTKRIDGSIQRRFYLTGTRLGKL